MWEYKEGNSFDLLIEHRGRAILIKPGPALDRAPRLGLRADVVFLGIGTLGKRKPDFQNAYCRQSVQDVGAKLVIPIHWDNFFAPLSENLPLAGRLMDDSRAAFDFLIARTEQDRAQFLILQGFGSVVLFAPEAPAVHTSSTLPHTSQHGLARAKRGG